MLTMDIPSCLTLIYKVVCKVSVAAELDSGFLFLRIEW